MPPVKGGAVENLIHCFVENNEKSKMAELTVFSSYDKIAKEASERYKNTSFVYIQQRKTAEAITGFVNRAVRKLRFGACFQNFPYLIDIVKSIKKSAFDCVIVENRPEFMPYLRKKLSLPIFLHMHNDCLNDRYYPARRVVKSATGIIAVSDYVKDRILTVKGAKGKVAVLRNVIDVKHFAANTEETGKQLRQERDVKDTDVVFGFVGRITPGKGVAELIQAFSRVCAKHENARLLVVGSGWFSSNEDSAYTRKLRALSADIEDKIIFTGYVDYNRITEQYASVDALVVPSVAGEACGLVVLEAMASGKALIVSDSGGIPEHVDSDCAIIVSRGENFTNGLASAMEELICDRQRMKSMGEHGSRRAAMYDKENYLRDLLMLTK